MTAISDHWTKDRLGRKDDAEFLYNFLIGEIEKRASFGRVASYVLNVDADWGGGKSFFLDGLAQDIEAKGHLVARVNAWRDDHAQDPYVAIMAAIDKVFEPYVAKPGKAKTTWKATKASGGAIALKVGGAVFKGLVKKHAGVSVDDIGEIIADAGGSTEGYEGVIEDGMKAASEQLEKLFDASLEAMIDGFNRTDAAMTDFRSKLQSSIEVLGETRPAPLFILIDELDRCRPTYAVQLLERVKHLFDVPGVVFVFATNSAQLQHSIAGAYGASFDGFRYLKRFFDRTYVFAEPPIEQFIQHLCGDLNETKIRAPENKLAEVLAVGCRAYGFDLRAITHVIEMMGATVSAWRHPQAIEVAMLFPLCAHFYATGKAEWPDVEENESLKQWVLKRAPISRYDGKAIDRSISLGSAYTIATGIMSNMQKIIDRSNRGSENPTLEYIVGAFNSEWNGVRVDRDAPSVQRQLLGMVANAGRMVKASSPG